MTDGLNELIHAPVRLQIFAFLASVKEAEFSAVREALGVSDSVLSKHTRLLSEAGYLAMSKPAGRGRVKTWLALTHVGLNAYDEYLQRLRKLLAL